MFKVLDGNVLTDAEEDEGNSYKRKFFEWFDLFFKSVKPQLLDFYCKASCKISYTVLMEQAQSGNDDAIFKLVRVFKNIEYQEKEIGDRCQKAKKEQDTAFLKNYYKALTKKPIYKSIKLNLVWFLLFNNEWIERHTPKEIARYLRSMGVEWEVTENAVSQYCGRLGLKTGEGKRGKRKGGLKGDVPYKVLGNKLGMSPAMARRIATEYVERRKREQEKAVAEGLKESAEHLKEHVKAFPDEYPDLQGLSETELDKWIEETLTESFRESRLDEIEKPESRKNVLLKKLDAEINNLALQKGISIEQAKQFALDELQKITEDTLKEAQKGQ